MTEHFDATAPQRHRSGVIVPATIPSRYRTSRYRIQDVATGYWVWDTYGEVWVRNADGQPLWFPYA